VSRASYGMDRAFGGPPGVALDLCPDKLVDGGRRTMRGVSPSLGSLGPQRFLLSHDVRFGAVVHGTATGPLMEPEHSKTEVAFRLAILIHGC
jgi:hypothetical protein